MSAATASASSLRPFVRAALVLAVFALIWGAKLFVIDRFGTDVPFWDQWEKEGSRLYPAWFERHELWRPLFSPHNEHRIAPTLAVNLALTQASGQWDGRVQCIVSGALHAALLAGLFAWALRRFTLGWALASGLLLALVGVASLAWENLLSGFQSQFYFLAGFSLLAINGLLTTPALSRRWWLGLIFGALSLVSMGSGWLWVAPVGAIAALRWFAREGSRRDAAFTVAAAALVLVTGLALHTSVAGHAPLRATGLGTFVLYAARCMAWPLFDAPWLGVIFWLPWFVLAGLRVRDVRAALPARTANRDDFLLGAGLWVLIQIAAVSYSRGAGGELPANRYGDLCGIGLAVAFLSFGALKRRLPEPAPFATLWFIVASASVAVAAHATWTTLLPAKKRDHVAYEQNVHRFVLTDDFETFAKQKLPFPNALWLADVIRRPSTRELLPASVRAPLAIPGFGGGDAAPAPPLVNHPTRSLREPGEWRSPELPATGGWWKLETAGDLGAPGAALQLVAVKNDRVLADIAPPKAPGAAWRSVYVRAPREPARLVARIDRGDRWLAVSTPVVMSALSYQARMLAKNGWLVFALGAAGGITLAGVSAVRSIRAGRSAPRPLRADNSLSGREPSSETHPFRMKLFTFATLLAAALVSAIVAVPFLPAAKSRGEVFLLEARVTSDAAGTFQVYYDDGNGLREELSARAALPAAPDAVTLRLPLPAGTYRALRVDPIDRSGNVTINSLRVVSRAGSTLAELPLAQAQPTQQIAASRLQAGRGLELVVAPGSDDPQLTLTFTPPLVVDASWRDYLRGSWRIVLPIFAGLATLLFLLDRAPRTRAAVAARARALAARPARAVAVIAAFAVVASAYPVVFLGKSYVSPNLGTILLYDNFPTLPGYASGETVDVKLSDVGAVMWQHVPFSMLQHRALAQGELPLWNRYNAAGVPLLAQGQSMFGDPLHLFVVAANGAAWAWDIKYLLAKWLFATGLGLTVLALTAPARPFPSIAPPAAGRSPLASSLLVAAAAPFIGFFLYRINHPAFFSLCYAPWPLYCLVRIAQASTPRGLAWGCVGLIAANLALMNSGTVKEAYMLLAGVNLAGACILLATAATWRERLVKTAALAWSGLLFVLLTAPIWATFLQTLKNAYTGYNAVSAYQIQPTLLLGAFDEIFYRPLLAYDRVFSPSLNLLLLLGFLYFAATLRLQFANRAVTALAAASLVPLALAFGLVSPQWIVRIPFLANIAHIDNTFSCVLIVLWSVLAGVGFATAAQRLGTREGRGDLIVAGLLLGALVFGWIAFRQASHRPIYGPVFTVNAPGQVLTVSAFIWDYLTVLLIAAVALAVLVHRSLGQRRWSAARTLLAGLCVASLLWRHGLHAASIGFENFTARPTVRADFHARSGAIDFARAAHAREPGRGFGFQGNFFPGWTGVYGLETIHGPDALVNPFLRELVGASGVERLWDWRLYVEPPNLAKARPFFDALNVRFYFDASSKHPALTPELRLAHSADLDVYESPTAWPRAFFTDRVDVYDQPAELIAKFNAANGRPLAAAQRSDVAKNPRLDALATGPATRTVTPATAYRLGENSTTFHVHASAPGAVVLTDAYWPGDFRAELNGRRTDVVRLNHAFQGVLVDAPGDYTVTFRYWPKNFTRNLVLCALGAALLFVSLVFALRTRRSPVSSGRRAPRGVSPASFPA